MRITRSFIRAPGYFLVRGMRLYPFFGLRQMTLNRRGGLSLQITLQEDGGGDPVVGLVEELPPGDDIGIVRRRLVTGGGDEHRPV